MSGKDRLGVEAEYWLKRAKRATKEAADRIDRRTGAVTSARRAGQRIAEGRDRAVDRSSQTRTGRAAGSAIRSLGSLASRLPLTGLTTDAISARHGLAALGEHLRANPHDPMAGARLLDAMARADADRRRYRTVRTVVDPTSWVSRAVSGTVGMMGREVDPFAERLGRSVYALAVTALRDDPADAQAWHALARVHLARGDAAGARQLAKIAVLADPDERPLALVTLARAELAAGVLPEAERIAGVAAAAGQSVGWDVRIDAQTTAALHDDDAASRRLRLDRATEWAALVEPDDRIDYYGVHVDGSGVVRAVADAQRRKTAKLADQARSVVRPTDGPGLPPPPPTSVPSTLPPPPPPPPPLPPPPPPTGGPTPFAPPGGAS